MNATETVAIEVTYTDDLHEEPCYRTRKNCTNVATHTVYFGPYDRPDGLHSPCRCGTISHSYCITHKDQIMGEPTGEHGTNGYECSRCGRSAQALRAEPLR
jgi:hypothetical protein